MDCSLPGSSAHSIFQARVLEWGAIAFSSALAGRFFTTGPQAESNKNFLSHLLILGNKAKQIWVGNFPSLYQVNLLPKIMRKVSCCASLNICIKIGGSHHNLHTFFPYCKGCGNLRGENGNLKAQCKIQHNLLSITSMVYHTLTLTPPPKGCSCQVWWGHRTQPNWSHRLWPLPAPLFVAKGTSLQQAQPVINRTKMKSLSSSLQRLRVAEHFFRSIATSGLDASGVSLTSPNQQE